MTDDLGLAFELPHARAVASSGNDPLDRISVRDYVQDVEIGAFQAERGVTQRIRFNVVLEVSRNAAAQSDDVDQVLSYDTITEAIQEQLVTARINLLETLAERVAERVLENPKSVRVFVRIEKLDRIPGTLGIEIVRNRVTIKDVLHPVAAPLAQNEAEISPLVVFLPNDMLHSPDLGVWLDAIEGHDLPAIICLDQADTSVLKADAPAVNRRISLLSIEQNAWVLAGKDPRCVVVDSRTELDWAMKNGQLSVWAPSKIVLDAVDGPKAATVVAFDLAQWFAAEVFAESLVVIGQWGGEMSGTRHVTSVSEL